jgi:ribosome-associated translation inhibitor RaiA
MQTPVQLEFEGVTITPQIRAAIDDHLAQLESRFGHIVSCRVTARGAGGHHLTGGLNAVHIHLVIPDGRQVNVSHTPDADERHSDLTFAINDAFKRARRQLQDQTRRLQGSVKHHETRPKTSTQGSE